MTLTDAREQLCKDGAQILRGSFTHAWRIYDGYIHEKIGEAVCGFINEVVTQTIWDLPFGPRLPLTRLQLYNIATRNEETRRRHRMKFGAGGKRSEYNLRWFPHNYAQAYRELLGAAEIYHTAQASTNKELRKSWRQNVKKQFPGLDDELIGRLSGDPSDLTEEHHALLAEKGGDSTPSEIALEQAARRCGVKRYSYTKRALLKRLEPKKHLHQTAGLETFLINWHSHGERLKGSLLAALLSEVGA